MCCLYLARCRSSALYICRDPNSVCCFPFPCILCRCCCSDGAGSSSWDKHQAEVWPLLTEMRFVFKNCCWGITFNISVWSDSSQLDAVCPDPAWSAKLVIALKNVATMWGILKNRSPVAARNCEHVCVWVWVWPTVWACHAHFHWCAFSPLYVHASIHF